MNHLASEVIVFKDSQLKENRLIHEVVAFLKEIYENIGPMQKILEFIERFLFISVRDSPFLSHSVLKQFKLNGKKVISYRELFYSIEDILQSNNSEI